MKRTFGLCALLLSITAAAGIQTCVTPPFSSTRILPTTMIGTLACKQRVELAGAPGQFVNASVMLQSDASLTALTLSASALSNLENSIASGAIDLRYVKVWYQAATAWGAIHQDRTSAALVPELLVHDANLIRIDSAHQENLAAIGAAGSRRYVSLGKRSDTDESTRVIPVSTLPIEDSNSITPIDLPANTRQQIWLTVAVPRDAVPGVYTGSITFRAQGIATSVPFQLTVYRFRLADPVLTYSIYYRGILDPTDQGSISSELKSRAQMAAELKDLREHGISNPTIYQSAETTTLLDQVLGLRQTAGISNENIFWLGLQSGTDNQRVNQLQLAKARYAASGLKKLFIYATDEAAFSAVSPQASLWSRYRAEGADIFAADYKAGFEKYYAGKIPLVISGIASSAASNAALHAAGTAVFAYNQPQVGIENPEIYRLNYGIEAWRQGFDGVMDYAYQHAMGSIWNDFDHPKFRDHCFAYPTKNGVIPTLAWEGFRAAVDDVRYVSTLLTLANALNSSADLNYLAHLRASGKLDLDQLRSDLAGRIGALCQTPAGALHGLCLEKRSPPESPAILPVTTQ